VLQENPVINLLVEFWPAGLVQAGVGREEVVEVLHGLNMNLTLVRPCGLLPSTKAIFETISTGT
jgi:hypothetical protein